MEDARLGVRGTDSALESALGGETSLMSAGGRSNAPDHRWISAFVTAFGSARTALEFIWIRKPLNCVKPTDYRVGV